MTATLKWIDDDQKVLCIHYQEPFPVSDVFAALDEMAELLDAVEHRVNLIVDLTEVTGIPHDMISSYPRIAHHPGVRHRNLAHNYVVIDNEALIAVIKIFDKLFLQLRIVRTFDEALSQIDEERASESKPPED